MKILGHIAGVLLGLLFIASSVVVLFGLVETPPPPDDDLAATHFMKAFGPTGYLTFVKVCELLGGILVAIPRTRNLGLLILGPIIVNILAFHGFVTAGEGLLSPMLIVIALLAVILLWVERKAWAGLVRR